MKQLLSTIALGLTLATGTACAQDGTEATFRRWAQTPPMGWNSWDCYYSSVNEALTLQNARYLRDSLKQHGWEYVVVDIRWYANHPSHGGGNYNQQNPDCVLDEYGRYLPSPTRFPSAMANGKNEGFKALADSLHAMGLKFGIHIMRGLPKYILNSPSKYKLKGAETITGSKWNQVYSSTTPACTWLADNLTVRNNDYGQLYYNSIIDLYASWGVDFIKVDDLSRPFYTDEIKMLRKAIDQCGRPIILSLSPGKTQYQYGQACLDNANMWRMMDDLWDNWSSVKAVFAEANAWQPYMQTGNYADCDMLPLGQISMTVADQGYCNADAGRWTRLTKDEQQLMMTLWGVCHSPLFFGGELTKNDAWTNSLLTNADFLRMHAYGMDARQVSNNDGKIVWTSTDPATGDRYLALFQSDAGNGWIYDNKPLFASEVLAYTTDGHKADVDITLPSHTKTLALVWDDGGDNWNYDHGDWLNPTFISKNGYEVNATGDFIYKKYTNSYYNTINENKNVTGTGKMQVMGTTYDRGFAADANALVLLAVPDSIVGFKATAALDDSGIGQQNSTTTMRFYVFDADPLIANENNAFTASAYTGCISRKNMEPKQVEANVAGATTLTIVVDDCGDGFAYDRADMANAVLIDGQGNETPLSSLDHASYTSSWGAVHKNKNVEGGPLVMDGVTYESGLGINAACTLTYNLPADKGYVTFRALCGLDDSVLKDNPNATGSTIDFRVFADNVKNDFTVDLTSLGYEASQAVTLHDIWQKADAGTATGTLTADVPSHGTRLFRLSTEREGSSAVGLEATPQADGKVAFTATLTGTLDDQSYVQLYIDGKPAGSLKATTATVTYHIPGLADGQHTAHARFSGSKKEKASQSAEVQFGVATDIAELTATDAARPNTGKVYNLRGQQVGGDGQLSHLPSGLYIVDGAKVAK